MSRALSVLLVLVASFGIAHGDLLRPCQCGPQNPLSCGFCPAGKAATTDAAPSCCCQKQSPSREDESENGTDCFSICPGPRAPSDVPETPVELPEHVLSGLVQLVPAWLSLPEAARAEEEPVALPACPPWRISPEGLTVFLT